MARRNEIEMPNHKCSARALTEAGLDDIETVLLNAARHFFVSYTDKSFPYWETSMDICNARFGHERGPQIAVAMMNLLRHMRQSRKSTFHFTNPFCRKCANRISDCECHLFSTIKHTRAENRKVARMEALMLCEGFDPDPMLEEVEKLARLLNADLAARGQSKLTTLQ